MPTKESLITYQASQYTPCLQRLVSEFGDRLESLTAVDKLDLMGVLSFWQSADTEAQGNDMQNIDLSDWIGSNSELQSGTSRQLDRALEILDDISDQDTLDLLVALVCQLRDGVYAE
ncbi:MAG: hypothetical protein LH702_01030 [Phormidesmis sp. CAN_BIN44]|nr:hypothetical protein [Phormidesmis sp. CAN_BIN44]